MVATVRDAATVIVARPTSDGTYEVLMTKRPETMAFMGGTYVFPGGTLDNGDASKELAGRSALTAAEAADKLGEDVPPDIALGLFVCALRELFEEVGILLARTADGEPVPPDRVRDVYGPRQSELGSDPDSFARFLTDEKLVLATDLLVPHGRLITPQMSPIRFDARFFVAPHPEGQTVVPDTVEVSDVRWIQAPEAIRQAGTEGLAVPIPTMAILQGLAEVPSYAQILAGRRVTRDVHTAQLSPLVWQVLAPNPGLATGPGTNTYVIGTDELVIVDPAVPDPVYIEVLTRIVGDRGRPVMILLTHLHPDHVGGAGVLSEELGIPVGAWAGAVEQAPYADAPVSDDDVFRAGGATLRAVYTPGHASHHLCFLLEEERSLFAGDVVAGLGTVVIAPPDGNMAAYLKTLGRLRDLDVGRIYPGHGPVIEDGRAKLEEYISHRSAREAQVVEALEAGIGEIPAMVGRIYADVDPALHPMAEMSVLAHLEMLAEQGRATLTGDVWSLVG